MYAFKFIAISFSARLSGIARRAFRGVAGLTIINMLITLAVGFVITEVIFHDAFEIGAADLAVPVNTIMAVVMIYFMWTVTRKQAVKAQTILALGYFDRRTVG